MSDSLEFPDFQLNGGVLVIGSLSWDNDAIRQQWRKSSLALSNGILAPAPIRYGRYSKERGVFTMVFSTDCKNEKMGQGVFLPFINNPVNANQLHTHSLELIRSERKGKELDKNRYSWSWGALGLCINPQNLVKGSPKEKQAKILLDIWSRNFGLSFTHYDYCANGEESIMQKGGLLNIEWSEQLEGFDFLIATATKPNKEYPSSEEIAAKMIERMDESYFRNNVANKISTYQDEDIMAELSNNRKS